jgi:polyhydroxyalkanoate synthesis repressor PhaR
MRYILIVTGDPSAPAPRSIRRYGNRKLYDSAARRYVTLEDVARLVAEGQEVEVVDQKTGEDLTTLTLAQVLLDGVKQGATRIPRQVLIRLVRIAALPAAAWGDWPEPRDTAGRARLEAERIVSQVVGRGRRLSLDDAVALRRDLGQMVHRLVEEAQSGLEARLRSLLEKGGGVASRSLGALRGRIEALGAPLEEPTPPPARPRRKGGARRPKKKNQ